MIIRICDEQSITKVDEALVRRGIRAALKGFPPAEQTGCEVSVALVDDAAIARLHEQFMNDPEPTDVITFPLGDDYDGTGNPVLGEIVISVETARREAKARRQTIKSEVLLYAIHGALHLAGYDDKSATDAQEMEARQELIRAKLLRKK